tara:strand:- start:121 stop:465 length:345 start_codon:yes stop_codon:yes gene_type:complete
MIPGLKVFAVAGVPPGKLQLYVTVSELGAQASTLAIGVIDAEPQESLIELIAIVGGLFTSIVSETLSVPQEFVVVKVRVYVPAVIKLKEGAAEFSSVPLVKLHCSGAVPQNPEA